jgi:hypothetical protein
LSLDIKIHYRYGEAETILTECTMTKQKLYDEIIKEYGDYSCFVLQLLAHVYRYPSLKPLFTKNHFIYILLFSNSKTDRINQSIEFHKKCLRLNPFLWSSFEAICSFSDEKLDLTKYFNLKEANDYYTNISLKQQLNNDPLIVPVDTNSKNPFKSQSNGFCVSDLFALKVSE